jgi:dynein light chain LC8-type
MGLSFLALIFLVTKLYNISKEVSFLRFIESEWLQKLSPNITSRSQNAQLAVFHMENLRKDIDLLIIELWSSRTTLILGMVFVFAYILSWGWMTYVIQETRISKDVSLKTVLLLVVFAAVDIAASTGFVMVRLIMYSMRDHIFPKDLRTLSPIAEHDQMAAFSGLRLTLLQSSSGTTDIFVSGVVAFLTGIRVYIVVCAVSFYNKIRKGGPLDMTPCNLRSIYRPEDPEKPPSVGSLEDVFKPHLNYPQRSGRNSVLKEEVEGRLPPSSSSTSVGSGVGHGEDLAYIKELKIQAADMPLHMQRTALHSTAQALRVYGTEKHIAESVKQDFDQLFGLSWHCIVGRNWGSCVTHSKQCYIRILYRDFTVLLYKST